MKIFTRNTIEYAIKQEVESYEFYKEAAKKVEVESLVEIFEDLAAKGIEQKEVLENFLSSGGKEVDLPESVDYGVAETLDMPKITTDMDFKDAIQLAIKREEQSMQMYQGLYDNARDLQIKDALKEIVGIKQAHKVKLEELYIDTAYGEVW